MDVDVVDSVDDVVWDGVSVPIPVAVARGVAESETVVVSTGVREGVALGVKVDAAVGTGLDVAVSDGVIAGVTTVEYVYDMVLEEVGVCLLLLVPVTVALPVAVAATVSVLVCVAETSCVHVPAGVEEDIGDAVPAVVLVVVIVAVGVAAAEDVDVMVKEGVP